MPQDRPTASAFNPNEWEGMHIGQRLRWARKSALGLTQIQLSEKSGVSQTTISSLEAHPRGFTQFPTELAKALNNLSVEWLIEGIGQPWPVESEDQIVEELHQTIKTMSTQKLKLLKNFLKDLDSL